jgi:hypothetical protein
MEAKKPTLNVRLSLENDDTVELIDDTELPEGFKRDVLSPYLRHLYDDLASRGSQPEAGINKTTFLEVKLFYQAIVSKHKRVTRRACFSSLRCRP